MLGDQLGHHRVLGALRRWRDSGIRHKESIGTIALGGAEGGADSGQNDGHGNDQHAI